MELNQTHYVQQIKDITIIGPPHLYCDEKIVEAKLYVLLKDLLDDYTNGIVAEYKKHNTENL
jgi:hypothetical protein